MLRRPARRDMVGPVLDGPPHFGDSRECGRNSRTPADREGTPVQGRSALFNRQGPCARGLLAGAAIHARAGMPLMIWARLSLLDGCAQSLGLGLLPSTRM